MWEDAHIRTDTVAAPSCSGQSRRSVELQRSDDSAHSFLAEPSLCASHRSGKQDSMPTYLTKLTPLLYCLLFYTGGPPQHTKLPTPHRPATWHWRLQIPLSCAADFCRPILTLSPIKAPRSQSLKHSRETGTSRYFFYSELKNQNNFITSTAASHEATWAALHLLASHYPHSSSENGRFSMTFNDIHCWSQQNVYFFLKVSVPSM